MFKLLESINKSIDNGALVCNKDSRDIAAKDESIFHKNYLKGPCYGTNHDLKKHANLANMQKNFFTLFLDQLILQKNRPPKISPAKTNSPFQSSSPSSSPLLPAEKAREWI
jgi:hypothetical protein